MKMDLRIRYTKEMIQKNFLLLLEEKEIGKITVKAVCDRAEINRGTFYKYYADCYALMDGIEEEVLARFAQELTADAEHPETPERTILRVLQDNRALFDALSRNHREEAFVQRMTLCYFEHRQMRKEAPAHDALISPSAFDTFASGGCGSILAAWLRDGMTESPESLVAAMRRMTDAMRRGIAENSAK